MNYGTIRNLYTGNVENLPNTSGVYLQVCNANERKYVGRAQHMRTRVKQEMNDMEINNIEKVQNKKMKVDFDRFGKECFEYYVLQECSENLSIYLEDFYIRTFDAVNKGYNSRYGDLKSLNKKHFSTEDKYFLSNIETVGKEYDWVIKKVNLEIFDKTSWRHCKLYDFINEFKVIINKYATIDVILEVLIKLEFPVFIYNPLGDFYYEITATEFRNLYNDEYSYPNKIIEDELKEITFNRNLNNVHVGTYRYIITEKLKDFVENYNCDVYQEIRELENKAFRLERSIKEKAEELKELMKSQSDEKRLREFLRSYYSDRKLLKSMEEEKWNIKKQELSELIVHKYNLHSLNAFKSMNTVIELNDLKNNFSIFDCSI